MGVDWASSTKGAAEAAREVPVVGVQATNTRTRSNRDGCVKHHTSSGLCTSSERGGTLLSLAAVVFRF